MLSRVLSPDELPGTYGKRAVWIEMRVTGYRPSVALYKFRDRDYLVFVVSTAPDRIYLDRSQYRISWRAWNRMPDKDEREAEKWLEEAVQ